MFCGSAGVEKSGHEEHSIAKCLGIKTTPVLSPIEAIARVFLQIFL